jgi:hypothetical protein
LLGERCGPSPIAMLQSEFVTCGPKLTETGSTLPLGRNRDQYGPTSCRNRLPIGPQGNDGLKRHAGRGRIASFFAHIRFAGPKTAISRSDRGYLGTIGLVNSGLKVRIVLISAVWHEKEMRCPLESTVSRESGIPHGANMAMSRVTRVSPTTRARVEQKAFDYSADMESMWMQHQQNQGDRSPLGLRVPGRVEPPDGSTCQRCQALGEMFGEIERVCGNFTPHRGRNERQNELFTLFFVRQPQSGL